jgi:hypothetical protein
LQSALASFAFLARRRDLGLFERGLFRIWFEPKGRASAASCIVHECADFGGLSGDGGQFRRCAIRGVRDDESVAWLSFSRYRKSAEKTSA